MRFPTPSAIPFCVTRLSHVVMNVRDQSASREFYENVVGLVVTAQDGHTVYLRGVEETAHHSLVLHGGCDPAAERLGFRVASEDDLDAAKLHFDRLGLAADWVDVPHQGRTLHVRDAFGVPLELCVTMPVQPRRCLDFAEWRGAAAARVDHAQVHVPDPAGYARFYGELGFRVSEFGSASGTTDTPILAVFLSRKGDCLDLVAAMNVGPRLHHFAFVVYDASLTLPRVSDLASSLGIRDCVEYGPGRHGLAPQQFLYLRDPDGHRVELVSHAYQLIDPEVEPVGWSLADPRAVTVWGPMPGEKWFHEASLFRDTPTSAPSDAPPGQTAQQALLSPS
jgi:catechol 2,3-dioxygenase